MSAENAKRELRAARSEISGAPYGGLFESLGAAVLDALIPHLHDVKEILRAAAESTPGIGDAANAVDSPLTSAGQRVVTATGEEVYAENRLGALLTALSHIRDAQSVATLPGRADHLKGLVDGITAHVAAIESIVESHTRTLDDMYGTVRNSQLAASQSRQVIDGLLTEGQ